LESHALSNSMETFTRGRYCAQQWLMNLKNSSFVIGEISTIFRNNKTIGELFYNYTIVIIANSSGLFDCSCFYAQKVTLKESFQPVISIFNFSQFSAYMQKKKKLALITIENTNKSQ